MSIRNALLLALAAAVIATALILGALEVDSIQRSVLREAQARVDHGLRSLARYYEQRLAASANLLAAAARAARIDPTTSDNDLDRLRRELGLTLLNLCDLAGRPLSGSHDPEAGAVPVTHDPVLRRALGGETAWGTVRLDAARLTLEGGSALATALAVSGQNGEANATTDALFWWLATPVRDPGGRVVAVLYGGRALNYDYALVDELRDFAFDASTYEGKPTATVTIFLRGVRVATNVLGPDRRRAVGTTVAAAIERQVLEGGRPWSGRAWVVDSWYLSGYLPLRDPEGETVGLLFSGLLEAPFTDLRRQLVFRSGITASFLILLSLGLAALLVRRITRPLGALGQAAHRIAQGELGESVAIRTTFSETHDLVDAFHRMQGGLAERDRRLREQNAELATTNARLAETNTNYMEMLGFVTHELKSPTAAVQMLINGLVEVHGEKLPPALSQPLVRIQRNCEEMQDMIRDYLDLSRAERGEFELHVERIDLLHDVVEPSVTMTRALFTSREIALDVDVPAGIALDADPELLRSLVGNFLSNAAKYGTAKGRATLEARITGAAIEISVWNEGPGFTPEEAGRLFEKFARIRNADTRDKRGSGLGLWFCRRIAELHGGTVRAESEPGAWARFTLSLPRPLPAGDETLPA